MMNPQLKLVPKGWQPEMACLYLICHPSVYIYSKSMLLHLILSGDPRIYVGVTTMKLSKRVSDHAATRNGEWRQETGKWMYDNWYNKDRFYEFVRVLWEGTKEEMFLVEYYLRREPGMGINVKVGGRDPYRYICPIVDRLIVETFAC
jgi:hypothetical protein